MVRGGWSAAEPLSGFHISLVLLFFCDTMGIMRCAKGVSKRIGGEFTTTAKDEDEERNEKSKDRRGV